MNFSRQNMNTVDFQFTEYWDSGAALMEKRSIVACSLMAWPISTEMIQFM